MTNRHIVVIDPIAFTGGSKVATNHLLSSLQQPRPNITVITKDPTSWSRYDYRVIKLFEWSFFANIEQGIYYFIRHWMLGLSLIYVRLRYGKIDIAIGASGPGVDLSLYLMQFFLRYQIIQLIHGPVANSRTIARCLLRANHVFYLKSSLPSIQLSLLKLLGPPQIKKHLNSDVFNQLNNSLPEANWPTQCQYHVAKVLWAASLLTWKGLDFFVQTMQAMPEKDRLSTEICYIIPQETDQPTSKAPIKLNKLQWHQQPQQLDAIRATCNIFVSTSTSEPFGLSILEAMAAGHCVVIPSDNSYWDQVLCHDVNCVKYRANNQTDLINQLSKLKNDLQRIKRIGSNAQHIATQYRGSQLAESFKIIIINNSQEHTND